MHIISGIFEALMLICFGIAWPFSIGKMITTGNSSGKSARYDAIILAGYIAGIFFKIFGTMDLVILLYIFNTCLVSVDLILIFRYRQINSAVS